MVIDFGKVRADEKHPHEGTESLLTSFEVSCFAILVVLLALVLVVLLLLALLVLLMVWVRCLLKMKRLRKDAVVVRVR